MGNDTCSGIIQQSSYEPTDNRAESGRFKVRQRQKIFLVSQSVHSNIERTIRYIVNVKKQFEGFL